MKDYSEKEKEEFGKLFKKILEIEENIKRNFYSGSYIQKSELIMKDAEYIQRYHEEVPLEIKNQHQKSHKVDLVMLVEGLLEAKRKN